MTTTKAWPPPPQPPRSQLAVFLGVAAGIAAIGTAVAKVADALLPWVEVVERLLQ
jgi:hypothetical protein